MSAATKLPGVDQPRLSSDQVLRIARLDAEQAYRDLTPYCICITQEPDGWHVDYLLKDQNLNGGGPHYLINPLTGDIVAKKYEQVNWTFFGTGHPLFTLVPARAIAYCPPLAPSPLS